MKLVVVTSVKQYRKEVLQLFKIAGIKNLSESAIEGHKFYHVKNMAENWFSSERNSVQSNLFFSFNEVEKIERLFELIQEFNEKLASKNPLKAIVLPIEKSI